MNPLTSESGYIQCKLFGEDSGCQIYCVNRLELDNPRELMPGRWDNSIAFVFSSRIDEMVCAYISAAALSKLSKGKIFCEASGKVISAQDALSAAKDGLRSFKGELSVFDTNSLDRWESLVKNLDDDYQANPAFKKHRKRYRELYKKLPSGLYFVHSVMQKTGALYLEQGAAVLFSIRDFQGWCHSPLGYLSRYGKCEPVSRQINRTPSRLPSTAGVDDNSLLAQMIEAAEYQLQPHYEREVKAHYKQLAQMFHIADELLQDLKLERFVDRELNEPDAYALRSIVWNGGGSVNSFVTGAPKLKTEEFNDLVARISRCKSFCTKPREVREWRNFANIDAVAAGALGVGKLACDGAPVEQRYQAVILRHFLEFMTIQDELKDLEMQCLNH